MNVVDLSEGEGLFHRVQSHTRMVLYRVQAGADRAPKMVEAFPADCRIISP